MTQFTYFIKNFTFRSKLLELLESWLNCLSNDYYIVLTLNIVARKNVYNNLMSYSDV